MAQFDVFANPVASARSSYPYVVVLQSDISCGAGDIIVAPLAPRTKVASLAGRLLPIVSIEGGEFVVMINSLTALPAAELRRKLTNLTNSRSAILSAIDLLFFGI